MSSKVLILGTNGRFGKHMAEAFWNAGWEVIPFDRETDLLSDAAQGIDVIVNGWNPPYPDWARQVPTFTKEVIAAAKSANATVILPGNVYVFGKGSGPSLSTDTSHNAANPLGRIRVELEAAYRDAGVKTILLRAGDFLDTEPSGNWFDLMIAKNADKGTTLSPGDPDAPHAWAYLPDMARAAVTLAERREMLDTFEDIPFPGYTLSLRQVASLVEISTGKLQRIKRQNWLPILALAPFWEMGRCLAEMRYLWSMPHHLDAARFDELLPNFRETDPLTAICHALAHLDIHPDQPVTGGKSYVPAE